MSGTFSRVAAQRVLCRKVTGHFFPAPNLPFYPLLLSISNSICFTRLAVILKFDRLLPRVCSASGFCWSVVLFSLAWPAADALAQTGSRARNQVNPSETKQATGIAVVELFTSQGCSSCPPADAALEQIASVAAKNELSVFVLSFHVDYWDHLGWKDPYGDAVYSNRQRSYARANGSDQIYTPQMIVSGTTEFVGSDKAKAHAAITKSLGKPQRTRVTLGVEKGSAADSLKVQYGIAGATDGMVLNVALVQTPKSNKAPRGENAGRELQHINVVRAFEIVQLEPSSGTVTLQVPDDVHASEAMVIAYVQSPKSLAVTGVASAKLPKVAGE